MSNYSSILLYGSLTPGAVPPASALTTNLSGVELAVNAADGKLYFKDTGGFVRLLADASVVGTGTGIASITGGTIDGAAIGLTTPSTANFSQVTVGGQVTFSALTGLLKSTGSNGVVSAVAGVDYLDPSSLGAPLGAASLDAAGKLLVSQLPASITGALYYAGVWDAATNTPPLSTGIGVNGTYYKVSVAGTTSLDGINSWAVGDEAIFSGTAWTKIQGTDAPVQSVNGQTGAVIITRASLSAAASGANSDITSLSSLTTALSVSQGGTGRTTLSGMLKGNGTSGIVSAVAGVDFAPATSGTVAQLLANNGAGGFANVTIGTGLSLLGGELTATAGTAGSVTSIDVSGGTTGISFTGGPITHNGTITMTGTLGIANGGTGASTRQAAINALVGSTTASTFLRGSGNDVSMSPIQAVDVPILNQNTTGSAATVTGANQPAITSLGVLSSLIVNGTVSLNSELIVGTSSGAAGQVLTSGGAGQPMSWTTINTTSGNNGTVTSVAASGGTTGLTFSGSPITSAGTVTLSGVLAVNAGGTGTTTSTGTGSVVLDTAPTLNGASLFNGEINNATIGAAVPSSATFTDLTSTGTTTLATMVVSGDASFTSNGSVKLPSGTTAQRPVTSANGEVRYNNTLSLFEGFSEGVWSPLGGEPVLPDQYTKVTSHYAAQSTDLLLADTGGGTFTIDLPQSPVATGSFVRIADGNDFSVNKLILGCNGSTINGVGLDYEVVAGKIELTAIYDGMTWKLYAKSFDLTLPATGSGAPVRAVSPALVTPNLGTPSLITLTNANGLPLTSGVVGLLPPANGGTGAATITGLVKGNGTSPMTAAQPGVDYAPGVPGANTQLLASDGGGGFVAVTVGSGLSYAAGVLANASGEGTVTSVNASGGATGLSFSGGPITTSGTVVLSGILAPSAGGTGAVSLSGLLKGNGALPATAAVAGVDYTPATTGTSSQLLANNGAGGFNNVSLGAGLFYANGTLSSVSGVGTVTSVGIDGGTTGLAFGAPITGAGTFLVSGVLSASAGGTGAATLTGLVKGNGTAPMTAAQPGIDYAPATTGNTNQMLANNGFGGFSNISLGMGLTLNAGILNTSGMSPTGSVVKFNNRIGDVVPVLGDYDASLIGIAPTTFNVEDTVDGQLSVLGEAGGSTHIGFQRSGSNTIALPLSQKVAEHLSVTDFIGADPTGATSSYAAFSSAYQAAAEGQTIIIPSGTYDGVDGVLTGSKFVVWQAEGMPTGGGGWDLPGLVVQTGSLAAGKQYMRVTQPSLDDYGSGISGIRLATFSGGSTSVINTAFSQGTVVGASNTNVEITGEFTLANGAVAGAGNTALNVDAQKMSSGSTLGAKILANDQTMVADPTGSLTGLQAIVSASGTDALDTRNGIVLLAAKNVSGTAAEIGSAIKIGSLNGAVTDAWFKNGIVLSGKFADSGITINNTSGSSTHGLLITGSAVSGVSVGGTTDVGIDLSVGVQTTAAIRMRGGAKISFNTNDANQLSYQAGGLTNQVNSLTKHQLIDNGDIFMTGRLSLLSSAVSNTAGAATGQYLTILIDGNPLKIPLFAVS